MKPSLLSTRALVSCALAAILGSVAAAQTAARKTPVQNPASPKAGLSKLKSKKPTAGSMAAIAATPRSGPGTIAINGSDSCTTPDLISGAGPHSFDTQTATTGAEGQGNALCDYFGQTDIENDVWYEWTAGFTGTAELTTCIQTSMDSKVAVYAGSGCPTGAPIACIDDDCGLQTTLTFSCTSGSPYTIQLGNYPTDVSGSGSFSISQLIVPANDDCSTPTAVSGAGPHAYDTSFSTTGSQGQSNCNCFIFGTSSIADDVWFQWNASFTGVARVSLCAGTSSAMDTKVAVYRGSACPTLPALNCDDDFCTFAGPSETSFQCISGQNYVIQIGLYPGGTSGSGTFTINAATPTGNDDCSLSTAIAGPGPHAFDNSAASTGEQGQCNSSCNFFGTTGIANDVWFKWTAGFSGPARVSLCAGTSSAQDTKVAVYAGASCTLGANLGCDDDYCVFAGPSQVIFSATSGNVYLIQLGSYPGAFGGPGTFTVDPFVPPPGDLCTGPIAISGAGPHSYDNTQATTGSEGQNEALCNFFGTTNITNDVWYTWTAPCSAPVVVSSCSGGGHDSKIAVYAGAGCPTAAALACDDDFCCLACPSELTFNAVGGQTYTIQLGDYPGAGGGTGTFTTICQIPPGPMTSFCHPGIAGVSSCPCGNDSATAGAGCDNSGASPDGATLTASGTASLSADNVVLTASGEDNAVSSTPLSIFLQGDSTVPAGVGFGDGMRCVGGTLKRLYVKNAVGGVVSAPDFGAGDPSVSVRSSALGDTIPAGQNRYYMVYYRDPSGTFCPPTTFNATQAGNIAWSP